MPDRSTPTASPWRVTVLRGGPSARARGQPCRRPSGLPPRSAPRGTCHRSGYHAGRLDRPRRAGRRRVPCPSHGRFGEDGELQKILEARGRPLWEVGPRPRESASTRTRRRENGMRRDCRRPPGGSCLSALGRRWTSSSRRWCSSRWRREAASALPSAIRSSRSRACCRVPFPILAA